jgi:hypothetical protein
MAKRGFAYCICVHEAPGRYSAMRRQSRIFILVAVLTLASAVTVQFSYGAPAASGGGTSGGGTAAPAAGPGHGTASHPGTPGTPSAPATVHQGWGPGIDPSSTTTAGGNGIGPIVNPSKKPPLEVTTPAATSPAATSPAATPGTHRTSGTTTAYPAWGSGVDSSSSTTSGSLRGGANVNPSGKPPIGE